jgi:hypothetical protein
MCLISNVSLNSVTFFANNFSPYDFRFWKCKYTKLGEKKKTYEWCEWEMIRKDPESAIDISG